MTFLIDKHGRRQVCWTCGKIHAVKDCPVAARECRRVERARRERKAQDEWVRRYQAELRRIDAGEVEPQCMVCGGPGNRPNFAAAVAAGARYACEACQGRRAVAR